MKMRWRQYEIIFVTLVCAFFFINFFLDNIAISPEQAESHGYWFNKNGVPFDYFSNYIIPRLVPPLVLYLIFLFINLYIVPVLVLKKNFILLVVMYGIAIWILLAITFSIAFHYESLYMRQSISAAQLRIREAKYGFSISGTILLSYIVYAYLREVIINWLNRDGNNKAFRIMVVNKITGTLFIYLGGFIFFLIFGLFKKDGIVIFYLFFLLPVIIVILINVYWLFPWQHRNNLKFKNFFWRLFISPFVLAMLAWIIFGMSGTYATPVFPFVIWLLLVVVATPLSWLLFSQQRDKLEAMLQLQRDLGKTSADLQFLRSQINPHFLFNALNTLYGTALQENAERTAEGVQRLGDMMRFMLHENHQEKIHISRETEYLQNYIALQRLRTQSSPNITIQTDIEGSYCNHQVAPMLFIPFVENAFKHGISLKEKSWININLSCDEKNIYFDIYNSTHSKQLNDTEKDRSGIGLENVRQRLNLLYPGKHELNIRHNGTEYFVHLIIQIEPGK